jgi:PPM family protein phosphatase
MKLKSYTSKTHQGPFLNVNEDDVEIDLVHKLYMIFDGFGGASIGDRAVGFLKDNIKKFYTRFGVDPDSTMPFYFSPKYLLEGNALINSMHYAHTLWKKELSGVEMSARGGASAIAVSQSENLLTFAATGNCIGLMYRKGHLYELIAPDSMKSLSPDDFYAHFYTAPVSGFGLFDDLHLTIRELRAYDDDLILLLTDGAYGRLDHDEIKYIIQQTERSSIERIDEIFKLSNSRGNLDNQSAILLQF